MTDDQHSVSIWFFIGALLLIYGVLITGAGVYNYFVPPERTVYLQEYHAGIWWGALLAILGGFYTVRFLPGRAKG
jgi:hypothetical protein